MRSTKLAAGHNISRCQACDEAYCLDCSDSLHPGYCSEDCWDGARGDAGEVRPGSGSRKGRML